MPHRGQFPHSTDKIRLQECRGAINVMKAASFGAPESRRSLSDIDKHIKAAPDKPQDHTTAKKRSIFGKSKK